MWSDVVLHRDTAAVGLARARAMGSGLGLHSWFFLHGGQLGFWSHRGSGACFFVARLLMVAWRAVVGGRRWIWALACVVLAIRVRAPAEPPRLWVRVASAPVKLFIGLCLIATLGMLHRAAYFTAFILWQPLAVTAAVLEGGGLAICAWVAWRRPGTRPGALAVSAVLLFVGSIQYIPMAA